MTLVQILTSLDGRLNRKPYWIVGLVLLVIVLVAMAAITVVGVQTMDLALVMGLSALVQLLVIYPSVAVMVKRFHDRNRSGALVLFLIVPVIVVAVTDFLGITGKPLQLPQVDPNASLFSLWLLGLQLKAEQQPLDFALGLWIFVVTVWFLIELGFFRGTRGPNRFGPDPLVAKVA
jgi:uncharacterized membrane protein YhaH (DUF805 family)